MSKDSSTLTRLIGLELLRPRDRSDALPILLQRTPYGVPAGAPPSIGRFGTLMKDGYIFVFQSMRGRFRSDGVLFSFMEQYMSQLEGPLVIQVWGRFLQLAKEILSNSKDFKAQIFPVLRFVVVTM